MQLDDLVRALDAFFRVDLVTDDDWSRAFAHAYESEAWREPLEPRFAGHWAGLAVRGSGAVERAVTCVFPGDRIVDELEPRTLLFSEHPLDYSDRRGFAAVDLERLRERECSLYVVHAPLYQHPELAPSLLLARGIGLESVETFFRYDPGLPGGAAAIGSTDAGLDGLADRIRGFLGPRIPVLVLTRTADRAGTVAVAAGSGARVELLEQALERGCTTFVAGNAATNSEVERVQERVRAFRRLADAEHVSLLDATHYGTERPPQLAMVDWFRARGLSARFAENGPR
jgi:putative NIF3 family GTP cyclohydrolase 1 type 2